MEITIDALRDAPTGAIVHFGKQFLEKVLSDDDRCWVALKHGVNGKHMYTNEHVFDHDVVPVYKFPADGTNPCEVCALEALPIDTVIRVHNRFFRLTDTPSFIEPQWMEFVEYGDAQLWLNNLDIWYWARIFNDFEIVYTPGDENLTGEEE